MAPLKRDVKYTNTFVGEILFFYNFFFYFFINYLNAKGKNDINNTITH